MKLIAINTIGLTGAEILCAELARHPEIQMLPGQNFIRFKNVCYRPHDYSGMSANSVFEMLSMHHFTRSGKCWSGLTKSMSPEMKASYQPEKHCALFVAHAAGLSDFLELAMLFTRTFYQSMGIENRSARYVGWFGSNIAFNATAYPHFDSTAMVINFSNPIDYWLANINQRFVWNNIQTLKFWIVNELFIRWFGRHRFNFLTLDIRDYVNDRNSFSLTLRRFLGLNPETPLPETAPDGFIAFRPDLVAKIEEDAKSLVPIYQDHALYKLAATIGEWSGSFLEQTEHIALLRRYQEFWNTTSHTNLDWIGPIEEELVERALSHTGFVTHRNLSHWFYHECFELTCDHYEDPKGNLEHYLGSLEESIALPPLAYYARVVVRYIENVADNCLRRPYSAVPIRQTNLYRRLMAPESSKFFELWAMKEKIQEMEQLIDRANEAMSAYFPVD